MYLSNVTRKHNEADSRAGACARVLPRESFPWRLHHHALYHHPWRLLHSSSDRLARRPHLSASSHHENSLRARERHFAAYALRHAPEQGMLLRTRRVSSPLSSPQHTHPHPQHAHRFDRACSSGARTRMMSI
jgi:hypothetical protein